MAKVALLLSALLLPLLIAGGCSSGGQEIPQAEIKSNAGDVGEKSKKNTDKLDLGIE